RYDTFSATVQILKTAAIAESLTSPSKLTAIASAAYNHTAATGVWVRFEMRRHTLDSGTRSSRAKAKMVRLPDCRPGMATRFMTAKPASVKKTAGARP